MPDSSRAAIKPSFALSSAACCVSWRTPILYVVSSVLSAYLSSVVVFVELLPHAVRARAVVTATTVAKNLFIIISS